MSITHFDFIPAPPYREIDWHRLDAIFGDWFRRMWETPQNPAWHGEGDVLTHTKMVCETLVGFPEWRQLPEHAREIVFISALLHDIGKPDCTKYEDGQIVSPKHTSKGAQLARKILWRDLGMSGSEEKVLARETIVAMIRHHSLPYRFLENADPLRKAALLSCCLSNEWLAMLSRADLLGRIAEDRERSAGNVALFQEFASENGCLNQMYPFASDHSRCAYFSGTLTHPAQTLYDDTWGEVILLSGLPASGKDHYISHTLPGRSVISLDTLRASLKISWHDDQGPVVQAAKEKAKEYLRRHQPFIWNATNITASMREPLIRLFRSYKARVKIVYLEAPWKTLLARNRSRTSSVQESAIETLLDKLDFPTFCEAHEVRCVVTE